MKKSQARGYLLEIVLSKLIEINGYELVSVEDNKEIFRRGNGLNVKGRGGFHQFDTMGRFKYTPPFSFPLRLFIEAKCYESHKVGIEIVRMGVGILNDINTNYSTVEMNQEQLSVAKYQYNYAIFSTSGFTEGARRFAIAHKIHLIDLSGHQYDGIRYLVWRIVEELANQFSNRYNNISNEEFALFKEEFKKVLIEDDAMNEEQYGIVSGLVSSLKNYINGKLMYLATINGPYIIPLFSNERVNAILRDNPHQKITITWEENQPDRWIIGFVRDDDNSLPRIDESIEFILPADLLKYMLTNADPTATAWNIKNNKIGKLVFIAYLDSEKDNPTICTLTFDEETTRRIIDRVD